MKTYNGIMGTKIDRCKELADPAKYLGLFKKHLPKLENAGAGKKIALVDLSSLEVEYDLVMMYPKAEFHIFDNDFNYEIVQSCCKDTLPNTSIFGHDVEIDESMYNIVSDMKFDVVVGYPPYSRSLHLKVLKKTMEHVDFDNGGEIIWLHPDRWINKFIDFNGSPLEKLFAKKLSSSLAKIDFISNVEFAKLFGLTGNYPRNGFCVSCWKLTSSPVDFNEFRRIDPIALKVLKRVYAMPSLRSRFDKNANLPFSVSVRRTCCSCLPWTGATEKTGTCNAAQKIYFQTEVELENFKKYSDWKSYNFWKWLKDEVHWTGIENSAEFPFMPDYTQPWTDERFYKFFELTPDEIKLIEDTVK